MTSVRVNSGESNHQVWTIQPFAVWDALQVQEAICVEPSKLPARYIPEAYRWLQDRISKKDKPGGLPWWVYYSKPDLRLFRHRCNAGQRQARIELLVPDHLIVRFPSDAWSRVYSGLTLNLNKAMNDSEEIAPEREEWICQKTRQSWDNLFSPELIGYGPEYIGVVPVIESSWVRRVTLFEGCRRVEPQSWRSRQEI